MAATNRDLKEAVAKGKFREDLYYRLNVVTLAVPPLRDRSDEIIPLAEQFLIRSAVALKKPVRTLGASAQALLRQYRFPGNIRELSNLMERAVLFCQGPTLEAANFPSDLHGASQLSATRVPGHPGPAPDTSDPTAVQISFRVGEQSLNDLEDRIIAEVLQRSDGNKTLAAKHLGITRWMLDRRRKN
jgi:two-component system response regulator AtoC